ncbi:hypothetical protein Q5752_000059 [Cryptotrichosporon argae]
MFNTFAQPAPAPMPAASANPYAQLYPQLPGLPNHGPLVPYAAPGSLAPPRPPSGHPAAPYGYAYGAGGMSASPSYAITPSVSLAHANALAGSYSYQPSAAHFGQPGQVDQVGQAGQGQSGQALPAQAGQPGQQHAQPYGQYADGYRPYYSTPTSVQPQPVETPAPDEDAVYGPLGRARGKIERAIVGDNEISPDLADTLGATNEPPYVPPPTQTFRPVRITKSTPLPDALHQELNFKHLTAKMGLFEEIARAWFTVDNKLFLWDYKDGREFSRYDDQPDTIQAVGLVRARKDVFVDDITHVLVIATATRITLLGLAAGAGAEINLYATNLSADAPAPLIDVRGTHAGRVFALGANKDLYEIEYSTTAGWLGGGSRMWVSNRSSGYLSAWVPSVFSSGKEGVESFVVDPAQNRLFALHTRGEVELIDVTGSKFESRAKYAGLKNDFVRLGYGGQAPHYPGAKVVSIAAVGGHESRKAWVVAISASGARAYLGSSYMSSVSSLALIGYRPPPPEVASADAQTYYSSGTLVVVSSNAAAPGGPQSKLTFVIPHPGRQSAMRENYENFSPPVLQEWAISELVPSQIWTMAETPAGDPARSPPSLRRDDGIGLSALPREADSAERTFVILATSGVFWATQTRPVDALAADLAVEKDGAIAAARAAYGRVQLAAMGAALGAQAGADATQADLAAAAAAVLLASEPPAVRAAASGGKTVVYSARHDGLATAIARALRAVWVAKVTATLGGRQVLGVSEKTLLDVQGRLEALRRYVDEHPFPRHQAEGDAKLAWDQEELSLHSLQLLLKQAVEAISFVLLLSDYKLPDIIARCDLNTQSTLASLTFQSLLTSAGGRDVARRLVTTLIEQQIGQELGIDTLSEILQQRCGSFCQPGDVVLYKAEESLRRAEGSRDPLDRADSLAESLRLFSRAASSAARSVFSRLSDVSKRYRALGDVRGTIELPLSVATELDPHDRAGDYVRDGRHDGDPRRAFYDERQECYGLVCEALEGYDDALDRAIASGASDAAMRVRDEAYALAIASDDELFHFYLYDWHVARGRSDQLLEFDTPYIERYLQLTTSSVEDRRDLLWKYYARREEYMAAARALVDLAVRPGALRLHERTYYLAQALTNAKSASSLDADDVEFTTGLQERVEVGLVQVEVARAVEAHRELSSDEKHGLLAELDELKDLDELYQDYARPLRLYDAILLILKTADTRLLDVVDAVWRQLVAPAPGTPTPEAAMAAAVTDLARRYWATEAAVPDVVVPAVLEVAHTLRAAAGSAAQEGWPTRALLDGGAGVRELWDILVQLYDEAQDKEYYAEQVGAVVKRWIETRDGIPPAEVEQFTTAYLLKAGARTETRRRLEAAKAAAARF